MRTATRAAKFIRACRQGDLVKAQELYIFNKRAIKQGAEVSIKYGHTEITKWLYSYVDDKNEMLRYSCLNGKLEIAKWLHWANQVEIYGGFIDDIFVWTCARGHLEVAKWLYSLGKIIVNNTKNYEAISYSYSHHLEVAKWLYSIGNFTRYYERYGMFLFSCSDGQLKTAKWLYSLGNIDVHTNNDNILLNCCRGGQIFVIEWLLSITKFKNDIINNNIIMIDNKKILKIIFDQGYVATNDNTVAKYKIYKADKIKELECIIDNEYIIADLWNIVFEFL